jgi:hypothetical protein
MDSKLRLAVQKSLALKLYLQKNSAFDGTSLACWNFEVEAWGAMALFRCSLNPKEPRQNLWLQLVGYASTVKR